MPAGDYDFYNNSELAQLALEAGGNTELSRDTSRDILIRIIEGHDVEVAQRQINKVRLKIMQYINDNWKRVQPLVTCPASSRDPYACYQCTDVQVAECIMINPEIFSGGEE